MKAMLSLLGLLALSLALSSISHAQSPTPIDVFVRHDRANTRATIYFTNPISGLSTPVEISAFPADVGVLDTFSLSAEGVIFRRPIDGLVWIATSDGRLSQHPFIPQNPQNLAALDWVLSPDGRSIAWVEVFPTEDQWLSRLYLARVDGQNLIELPAPPASSLAPFRRARPLALSDDRARLYVDLAAPLEAERITAYFQTPEDIYLYESEAYTSLPSEPSCICAAGIAPNRGEWLRLTSTERGFDLHHWTIETEASALIPSIEPTFAQAGDFLLGEDFALYSQAELLFTAGDNRAFALMLIDLNNGTQRILGEVSDQRLRALAFSPDGEGALVADYYGGATYKLDFATGNLRRVSEATWLGSLSQ